MTYFKIPLESGALLKDIAFLYALPHTKIAVPEHLGIEPPDLQINP